MNLFQSESDRYTQEQLSAREAQRLAEVYSMGTSNLSGISSYGEMGAYWIRCEIAWKD